eukprot:538096-Prymnesium_polylepis.1
MAPCSQNTTKGGTATSLTTKDQVPSCVKNWEAWVGPNIPFKKVFASIGTPLSDATEERQWRKLVHRSTYVRNRKHKQAPENLCRLCPDSATETIMHLFECRNYAGTPSRCGRRAYSSARTP